MRRSKILAPLIKGLSGIDHFIRFLTTMMDENEQTPQEDFPVVESFFDYSGKKREFVIELLVQTDGYFVRANEKRPADDAGGYTFAAYSPTDPFIALAKLRHKISRELATRYLVVEDGQRSPGHDRLKGHIEDDGVVVDGEFVDFEELWAMLRVYAGFQFELTIEDPYGET